MTEMMMRQAVFLVNETVELKPAQTTALLMWEATRTCAEVWVVDADGMALSDGAGLTARGRLLAQAESPAAMLEAARGAATARVVLTDADVLMIRTNPGRDAARWHVHELALELAAMARDAGVLVLNDPDGLRRAATKLYLSTFPQACRPTTLVSCDPAALRAFVMEAPCPCVVKPVRGSRGQDVFRVSSADTANLSQILDVLTRQGAAMAQHFVPEASEGDVRLVMLDGALLEGPGGVCAVRRVPAAGEFRSNVHIGGRPAAVEVTGAMREVAAMIGPQLRRDGLFLVGVDLVGARIVELNVFSTGGLLDAQRFTGEPFAAMVWRAVVQRAVA